MKWVIETTVFEKESEALVEEIKRQGHDLHLADGRETIWEGKPLPWSGDESGPIIVRGSIEFCNNINRNQYAWYPGVYMDMPNYSCTHYYPYFNGKLLNEEYVMLPFGELGRRKDWLYKTVGEADTVFIRPNRGNKIFTGQLVYKEHWDTDLNRLGFYDTPQDELCVVARPKNLMEEFRFIVVKDKVICGCQYKNAQNELEEKPNPVHTSAGIFYLAQSIINTTTYRPDIVWALDLAITNNELKVLEVGAFSCCGLYGCPPSIIVEEVSKAAQEDWNDIYG